MYLYTHKEIRTYVDKHLLIGGEASQSRDAIKRELVGVISQLPQWWQAIIIERGTMHVAGSYAFINKHGAREGQSILGFYNGGNLKIGKADILKGIYYRENDFFKTLREPTVNTIRHEHGHLIDDLLSVKIPGDPWSFHSDLSYAWNRAMEADLEKIAEYYVPEAGEDAGLTGMSKESRAALREHQADFYLGYRVMPEHLKLYNAEKHASESFAEISNHYAALFAQTGGDESAIDRKLGKHYPHLWERYKTEVIPKAEAIAAALIVKREIKIAEYIAKGESTFTQYGHAYDKKQGRERVCLALAAGEYNQALDDLDRLHNFFETPEESYAHVCENAARTRHMLAYGDVQDFSFDMDAARSDVAQVMNVNRANAGAAKFLKACHMQKAALTFLEQMWDLKRHLGLDKATMGQRGAVWPSMTAEEKLDEIFQEGGVGAVQAFANNCVGSGEIVIFVSAATSFFTMLKSIDPDKKASVESLVETAKKTSILKALENPLFSLQEQAYELSCERLALEQYQKQHAYVSSRIADALRIEKPETKSGILASFNRDTVKNDAENFKVEEESIKAYIKAAKQTQIMLEYNEGNIEKVTWTNFNGAYKIATGFHDFPDKFLTYLHSVILERIAGGGEKALVAETRAMEQELHSCIGRLVIEQRNANASSDTQPSRGTLVQREEKAPPHIRGPQGPAFG